MRASKSGSNDISEKSSAHSSTTMNEAATLRLVMEQNLAETDERCDVTPQGETGILIKPISTKVHLQVTDKGLIGMTYIGKLTAHYCIVLHLQSASLQPIPCLCRAVPCAVPVCLYGQIHFP